MQEKRYRDYSKTELKELIGQWNSKVYEGKYFEMFAVVNNSEIVGTVSLYEHSKAVISYGIEIFKEYRRKGYAYDAMVEVSEIAKKNGYKIATAQVKVDNTASLALCKKFGLEKNHEYVNGKGNKVAFLLKPLF